MTSQHQLLRAMLALHLEGLHMSCDTRHLATRLEMCILFIQTMCSRQERHGAAALKPELRVCQNPEDMHGQS